MFKNDVDFLSNLIILIVFKEMLVELCEIYLTADRMMKINVE